MQRFNTLGCYHNIFLTKHLIVVEVSIYQSILLYESYKIYTPHDVTKRTQFSRYSLRGLVAKPA